MASCVSISSGVLFAVETPPAAVSHTNYDGFLQGRVAPQLWCRPSESNEVLPCFHQSSLSGKYILGKKKGEKGRLREGVEGMAGREGREWREGLLGTWRQRQGGPARHFLLSSRD